jgi:SPP1 gp7 family putative phage head morphogenesis protein
MTELDVIAKVEGGPPDINPDNFIVPFSEQDVEMYLLGVWAEAITKDRLSLDYHEKVAVSLEDAMIIGFGGSQTKFIIDSPQYRTFLKLRENIYVFSAAKQYQQVRVMSQFISNNGVRSTFPEFKELAKKVFTEYNEQYLRSEWVTAIGQSQMAREWIEADTKKDIIPYLQYRTQRDSRVRDEHAILDGITLPVEHKFWNNYMPKNGWRCRCFTVSLEKADVTDLATKDLSELGDEKKFPKVFRMNPGKDGLIFNPKYHPYFFVARGDADLKANNFNMPVP